MQLTLPHNLFKKSLILSLLFVHSSHHYVLCRGVVREGDPVQVGPQEDGGFVESTVATIRRNRAPCRMVRAGQTATVTLTHIERADIRKASVSSISVMQHIQRG